MQGGRWVILQASHTYEKTRELQEATFYLLSYCLLYASISLAYLNFSWPLKHIQHTSFLQLIEHNVKYGTMIACKHKYVNTYSKIKYMWNVSIICVILLLRII